MTTAQALESVLNAWVNGRKVRDGIPLTIRQQAEQALLTADAQATVEALTKERDKAVTRCAHLDILLRDEYLPKLDVEAVKRSIADRDHRIDELEREIEQLDDTVEALQGQVKELEGNRVPHSMQHVIEWQAMNNRLGAQVEALQRELEHAKKMEAVQKEVADNQTWHVRELRAALDAEREKVKGLEEIIVQMGEQAAVLAKDNIAIKSALSQLQALVRKFVVGIQPVDCVEVDELLREARATLDATTPATKGGDGE